MLNGITLEYEAKVSLIEITLKKIRSIEVDTSDFENRLKEIKERIVKEIEESRKSIDKNKHENVTALINQIYENATKELDNFLLELDKYMIYFQAVSQCEFIQGSQNMKDFNKEELPKAVDDLIKCLNAIKEFKGMNEDDRNMLETLYRVIYNVIKLEYKYNGSSKLLSYCKESKSDSIFISKLIIDEVEELRKGSYDTSKIDLLMAQIDSKNESDMYLDEELFGLIAICKDKETYKKELLDALAILTSKVNNNIKDIKAILLKEDQLEKTATYHNGVISDKKYKNRKQIAVNIMSLIITLTTVVGVGYGANRLFKGNVYKTSTTAYSSKTGLGDEIEDYKRRLYDSDMHKVNELTTVTVYEPWEKDSEKDRYKRVIKETKITDVDLEELEAYLDLNWEELGYKIDKDSETAKGLSPADLYTEPIYEVTKEIQNPEDKKPGKISDRIASYFWFMTALFDLYTVIWMITDGFFLSPFGIIKTIGKLINEIIFRKLDDDFDAKELEEAIMKLKSVKNQLDELAKSNAEINEEYNWLMQRPGIKELLKQYEDGIALIEEYRIQMEKANSLTLRS